MQAAQGMKEGRDGVSPSCRMCCSTAPCFQAFLTAFTSVFLPRAYYRYIHGSSLHMNSTLMHTPRDSVLQSKAHAGASSCLGWLLLP